MKGNIRRALLRSTFWRSTAFIVSLPIAGFVFTACRSAGDELQSEQRGVIVVNAPAAGEVRRVLVREGMTVEAGAPVVEIAVVGESSQGGATSSRNEDPVTRAGVNIKNAQSEIDAARADVVRSQVEVQRLTPLVAAGQAPQAQLDGARALYERAQQRLQQAQTAGQTAQTNLITARQPPDNTGRYATAAPDVKIVTANATAGGVVSVISAHVGDHVVAGQPLATVRGDAK